MPLNNLIARVHLGVNDLEKYFNDHSTPIEDLLKLADDLVNHYITTDSHERALNLDNADNFFTTGATWTSPQHPANDELVGDQLLANTILRMRDSLLHYEFQASVADGDIGRAMNVMTVSPYFSSSDSSLNFVNHLIRSGHLPSWDPGRASTLTNYLNLRAILSKRAQRTFRKPFSITGCVI